MASYYKLQKEKKIFSLVAMDGWICMLGIGLNLMHVILFNMTFSFVAELTYIPYTIGH